MKTFRYNEIRSQVIKIFWITIGWTIFSVYQFLIGFSIIRELNCQAEKDRLMIFFMGSLITGLMAGVIGGSFLVLVWEKWLRSKNYGAAMFSILWSYVVIFFVVSFVTGLYFKCHELGAPFYSSEV